MKSRIAALMIGIVVVIGTIHSQAIIDMSVGNRYFYSGSWYAHGGLGGAISFSVEVVKDTTIGAVSYYVLQRSHDFRYFCDWTPPIDTGMVFLQRADSSRIYQYDPHTGSDIVLVDFADTINTLYPQFGMSSYMYSNDRNLIFGDSLQSPTVMFRTPYNEHDSGLWFMSYAERFGRTTLHYLVAGPVRTKVDLVYAIIKGVAYGDSTAITSVQRQPEPITFVVSTAYPNPFNATTRIAYSLSQTCRITAIIIDMSGRIVAQYDEGLRAPGTHLFRWGASHFPSGVYFVRLNAGQQTSTSKCLLLK